MKTEVRGIIVRGINSSLVAALSRCAFALKTCVFAALALALCAVPQARGGAFLTNSPMSTGRSFHTATLLRNGKVLVAGGAGEDDSHAFAEVYDPATGKWTLTGPMHHARIKQTAILLADGRVLMTGGVRFIESRPEIYDPATGNWTETGPLTAVRYPRTATLLPGGKVLLMGDSVQSTATTEIYDPVAGTWTPGSGKRPESRWAGAISLPGGEVLFFGGVLPGARVNRVGGPAPAEIYTPATGVWRTLKESMKMLGTGGSTATSLMDGTVLFLGREQSDGPAFCTYLYDSASGKWPATGPMNEPRQNHTATLLADGKVLAVGGQGIAFPGTLSSAELYNPSTKIWTKIPDLLTVPRSFHTATLLPNGKVLIAGGSDAQVINGRVQDYSSTELYDPQLQKGDDKDSPLR